MSKGSSILLAIVMAIGGFALGHVVGSRGSTGSETAEAGAEEQPKAAEGVKVADGVERFKVPVTGKEPSKGPKDALVTIVEFSEFQCPFCARVLPTMKQIQDEYGDKVRIVWRNNPLAFHKDAAPAAALAMEAKAQGGDSARGSVNARVALRGGEEGKRGIAGEEVRQGNPRSVLLSHREGWFPVSMVGVKVTHDECWGGKLVKEVAVF